MKDIDSSVKQYEKRLFNQLFKGRESVSTKTLQNSFFQHINAANQNINTYFKGENSLYDSKSQGLAFMGSIIGFLILGSFAMILNYARFGMMRFMSVEIVLFIGPAVVIALLGATVRGSELKQTKLWRVKKLIPMLGSLILMGIIYDTSLRFHVNAFYMLIGSGLTLLGIYNATQATQYTENGNDWMSQILGMKDFIKSVELDQLELLVEEDPHLFYNVLPFAYVLDLSDRWIKKFETLTIPPSTWYVTPMHYHPRMYRNLNTTMSKLNSSMTSVPAAKGSSGGGFSSGGSSGGSFGGGGFGGGGGGSW